VLKKRLASLAENVIDINDRRPIMQAIAAEGLATAGIQTRITQKPLTRKYLYFIRCGDAVKIGVSSRPEERIKTLQTGAHAPITLLCKIKNAGHLERSCHKRLTHLCLTGEWFKYTNEVDTVMMELQQETPPKLSHTCSTDTSMDTRLLTERGEKVVNP
jgi:hypothetical protein